MYINKKEIKRTDSIEFPGVLLDENITCKNHIHLIENKIAKNIGFLYKAKNTNHQGLNIEI